jgi:hypothetical protein
VTPLQVGHLGLLGIRFGMPALFFAVALASARSTERLRAPGLAFALAGAAVLQAIAAQAVVASSRELAPVLSFAREIEREPAPTRILPLVAAPRTAVLRDKAFDNAVHACDWINLATGGSDPYLFHNPFLPIRLTDARLPAPDVFRPDSFDPAQHGKGATHVVLRLPAEREPVRARALLARLADAGFEQVRQEADWVLLRRR